MTLHSTTSLEDRLPTFAEVATFDAAAAWERLTPQQQRELGMLAIRFGTVGQVLGYDLSGTDWTARQKDEAAKLEADSFSSMCEAFDPLWPQAFGWVTGQRVA